jgi:hypothetical protein
MNIEIGETRCKAENGPHYVVYAGKIRVVCDVEPFRGEQQRGLFLDFVTPAQAHVEVGVTRPEAGVAASANRPLVGGVIISVDLAACEQVKGVPAVIRENRSDLETGYDRILPRAIEHAGGDHLMALIELREAAVQAQICRVLRSVVTVEIRGRVEAFAVGVIPKQSEGIAS